MENFVDELVLPIFSHLNASQLLRVSRVCKKWYEVSKSQSLWKRLLLAKWPSQNWLYESIPVTSLNWSKVYKEFVLYGWYSPDQMKYFLSCNAIEDEPISQELRVVLLQKMSSIAQKWTQVGSRDHHDSEMINRYFDKNMDLFFNTRQLEWCFLDKRRNYLDSIYGRSVSSRKRTTSICMEDFIRPYQVIPSCLLMYRFLCMFRSFVVPDTGLTFYRIWRFRIKHIETDMIFELCDWKAASSSTFSNGRPNIGGFYDDAMELLQLVTHPHFIMHPLGLNPRVERLFFYAIRASAGGGVCSSPNKRQRQAHSSKKRRHLEPVSPQVQAGKTFGNQLYEKPMFPDIEEKLERWRARRKVHLLHPPSTRPPPSAANNVRNPFDSLNNVSLLSQTSSSSSNLSTSSSNTLLSVGETATSETQTSSSSSNLSTSSSNTFRSVGETATSETETDSQQESPGNTGGSDTSESSEFDFYENGYVTNCEYFISNTESFDSIEEQHSMQASIADLWRIHATDEKQYQEKVPVIYDIEDDNWYFQMEKNFHFYDHNNTNTSTTMTPTSPQSPSSGISQSVEELNLKQPKRRRSHSFSPSDSFPIEDQQIPAVSAGQPPPGYSEFYSLYDLTSDLIEPIPSSLVLYRLICLFDFNCSAYICLDDVSVWQVSMVHKKTQGVIHFKDVNGSFRVAVTLPEPPLTPPGAISGRTNEESNDAEKRQEMFALFDLTEFRASVTQLLDLLMSENFCHPYGIIAGTVA